MYATRILIVLSSFFFVTSSVFASDANLSQYYSVMHTSANNFSKNVAHPPVDITIINATSSYIYVVIPNSPINDYLSPGYNDHIYNYDPNVWNTYLVLQDPYRNTFYAGSVCRLAILTVYGVPGNYRQNLDSDLCQ